MFSITVNIHRNILSAQCSIKCDLQNTTIDHVKVTCTSTHLSVNFYNGRELLHDVKILTPENFFIPSSVSKQACLHEEVKLENNILTISRYCHNNTVTSFELPTVEKEAFQKREENCNPNVEKHMAFIDNSSSRSDTIDITDNSSSPSDNIDVTGNSSSHSDNVDLTDNSSSHADNVIDYGSSPSVEINFRIQISSGDLISTCSLPPQILPSLYDCFKQSILCPGFYQVYCTNCHEQLSEQPIDIHLVMEYSPGWRMAESWFCNKKCFNYFPSLADDALYVGATSIHVNHKPKVLGPTSDLFPSVCKACRAHLSYERDRHQWLFADAVVFRKLNTVPYSSRSIKRYCYHIVLISLWTIMSDKSYTCRLLFQSKVDGPDRSNDQCILIWVPPAKMPQFKLQSSLPASPTQVNFSTQDVYKVQYYFGFYSSPHVQMWKKDFYVEYFLVGSSYLNILKEILTSSTESMSGGQDIKEDFSTGCLPCSYPGCPYSD